MISVPATQVAAPSDGRRYFPLGLRARVIAAFGLGAGLLSLVLAFSTYVVVRHTLVEQRTSLAERQTFVNGRLLRGSLRVPLDPRTGRQQPTRVDVPQLLDGLELPKQVKPEDGGDEATGTTSIAVLFYQDKWFASDDGVDERAVPEELRELVSRGTPATMVFSEGNESRLGIGVPIPAVGASYFEISTLKEVEDTLSAVGGTLAVASIFTTLAGVALGRWASRLVLRPVTNAANAAEAIAGGDMGARLTPDGDLSLDRLVISFNRMVDALQGRMERDARFASDVSHELRSPLMTLASGLSVLQARRHELPVRSQTALDLLADEIQRFQRMVQDLLEISRGEGSNKDVSLDEVLVGEFVERVVERYERVIPIDVEDFVGDTIITVDKRRFERVIGNLIENADRYAGGVVRIGIETMGDRVRIIVDDAGPGVPVEERDRIFERFARGTSARSRASGEGTGLGLSLVYEHVQLHKGSVWVEERPGGGARFVVEIPKADD